MEDLIDLGADGRVTLSLHVQPGASRTEVVGRHGGALKVRVAAPPAGGRANEVLVRFLAGELGTRRGDVEVVAGVTGRRKRVRVAGADPGAVTRWLQRALGHGS